MRKKACALSVVLVLLVMIGVSTIPPAKAQSQFVIAGWDYPDEYGQGIEAFEIFGNSTGSWVQVGGSYGYEDPQIYEWNASVAIKLRCYTWFNSTLTGAIDETDGKNYQQHNVIVTDFNGTVFSQQNFTWFYADDSIDPPMWFYGYEVVLNFLPEVGMIYTVTVTYEIWW